MTAYELDADVDHCAGCGTITGNPWGLCTRCTDAETEDRDYQRPLRLIDPNVGIG